MRVKRIVDDESDEEGDERGRDAIANELFEGKFVPQIYNHGWKYLFIAFLLTICLPCLNKVW